MSSELAIRAARESDSAALCALLGELGYPTARDLLLRRLPELAQAGSLVLVAESAGAVVGLITAQRNALLHRECDDVRINSLVVAQAARGRGVGRRLVAEVESWARAQALTRIEVTSGIQRADAHSFYLSLGYENTSQRFSKLLSR